MLEANFTDFFANNSQWAGYTLTVERYVICNIQEVCAGVSSSVILALCVMIISFLAYVFAEGIKNKRLRNRWRLFISIVFIVFSCVAAVGIFILS